MVRFSMNRWLGFVLTLCLFTASFFLLSLSAPATALAEPGSLLVPSDPSSPGGPTVGDPDVPMGPGDGKSGTVWKPLGRVEVGRTMSVQGTRRVGDVTATGSVVMDRLRLVLLSLRSLYLGF
jgi:hypothetical protein